MQVIVAVASRPRVRSLHHKARGLNLRRPVSEWRTATVPRVNEKSRQPKPPFTPLASRICSAHSTTAPFSSPASWPQYIRLDKECGGLAGRRSDRRSQARAESDTEK